MTEDAIENLNTKEELVVIIEAVSGTLESDICGDCFRKVLQEIGQRERAGSGPAISIQVKV